MCPVVSSCRTHRHSLKRIPYAVLLGFAAIADWALKVCTSFQAVAAHRRCPNIWEQGLNLKKNV